MVFFSRPDMLLIGTALLDPGQKNLGVTSLAGWFVAGLSGPNEFHLRRHASINFYGRWRFSACREGLL